MSRILKTSLKHLLEQQQKTNVHWISFSLCKYNELGFTTCSAVAALSFRGNAAVKYGLQQIKQCPVGVLRRLVTSDGRRRDDKFSSVKDRTIKEITAGTIIEKAVCSPLNNQATSETSNGGICWFRISAYHLQTAKWSVAKSLHRLYSLLFKRWDERGLHLGVRTGLVYCDWEPDHSLSILRVVLNNWESELFSCFLD